MRPNYAVVFDLDDTLYPFRRFQTSGLLAVAQHIEATTGIPSRLVATTLLRTARSTSSEQAIEICLDRHGLPASDAPVLEEVFAHHLPRLRRPRSVARALVGLRALGWRIGLLANGQPTIEARKVAALGLEPFVDAVVYASTVSVGGKPHPDAFAAIARKLGAPASNTVVVGADELRDVRGAVAAGMHAIRCEAWRRQAGTTAASARLTRFVSLPALVGAAVRQPGVRRAA